MTFLVIGCGRSGTRYLASTMTDVGLNVGHEREGVDGTVSWLFTPDGEDILCPFGQKEHPGHKSFDVVIHQVRNPLDCISSCQTIGRGSWKYISKFTPQNKNRTLVYRCMQYWLYWNRLAKKSSCWTYKVEDFSVEYDKFCIKINRPDLITEKNKQIVKESSRSINTRGDRYKKLEKKDLFDHCPKLAEKIIEDSLEYGYNI